MVASRILMISVVFMERKTFKVRVYFKINATTSKTMGIVVDMEATVKFTAAPRLLTVKIITTGKTLLTMLARAEESKEVDKVAMVASETTIALVVKLIILVGAKALARVPTTSLVRSNIATVALLPMVAFALLPMVALVLLPMVALAFLPMVALALLATVALVSVALKIKTIRIINSEAVASRIIIHR